MVLRDGSFKTSLLSFLLLTTAISFRANIASDSISAVDRLPARIEKSDVLKTKNVNEARYFAAPVCGITCLHEAMRINGKDIDWLKLIESRFVSPKGSDAAQLVLAAKECGSEAVFQRHLSLLDLRTLDSPALLRVKRVGGDEGSGHWILFLGCDGQRFRILDPPGPQTTLTAGELLSMWDNSAVIVQRSVARSNWTAFAHFAGITLIGLIGVNLIAWKSLTSKWRVAFAILSPFVVQATVEILGLGIFWSDRASAEQICRRNAIWEPQVIEHADRLVNSIDRSVLLIDARLPDDFPPGHLPGAVSVPYFATFGERKRLLADAQRDRPIVVYCQSQGCPYAHSLAKTLYDDGFRNITVYTGGFHDWKQFVQSPSNASRPSE